MDVHIHVYMGAKNYTYSLIHYVHMHTQYIHYILNQLSQSIKLYISILREIGEMLFLPFYDLKIKYKLT